MKAFRRALYLVHRWLGIAMGLLMAGWCASGIVMLWHTWPQPEEDALRHVPTAIRWPFAMPDLQALDKNGHFQAFHISMVGQEPALTLYPASGHPFTLDLRTGQVGRVTPEDAATNAQRYAYTAGSGTQTSPTFDGLTTDDQWILDTHEREDGFYRFLFADAAHTQVYVSSLTGDVMQAATRASRLWAWVGAIPHWLYPAVLRRNPSLWKDVVIFLSGTGVFLTATGLWIGVLRLRRQSPFTPYRGWHCVHHLSGAVFGLFALLWVGTGLLTMSPFGLFQSNPDATNSLRVTGTVNGADIARVLSRFIAAAPSHCATIKSAFLDGHLFMQASSPLLTNPSRIALPRTQRLDESLNPAPLTREQIVQTLRPKGMLRTPQDLTYLTAEDRYYFSRPTRKRHFPVWRAVATDGTHTYLDAQSGAVLAILDRPARQSRWLVYGFHDLDFQMWLRKTPTHWGIALPLLGGVLCIFLSSVVLGVRRLRRNFQRFPSL
ncbi:hypothetical protein [Acetobacter orleanensis]|uniref:Peptidase n=1 Tax=Acetobacter orleanensis TaxID=104099 RepID=A0A4Y3TK31_9PROT|nr:hypothetical protein [Acetobacter orleanensis]KXV62914.1 hypothetical protein AD949_09255 [Acetobacter orleanensis]PCD80696.1 hypothetical protein CO710_02985 [Acetobacter orleanensis]GAN67950.1 propeptide PepSY amd peptidase M4 [Acetobacter orleanensis JCM 7639]GBR27548.1 PepSY-associated TM helix domain-containing protein [Acetobacter orleanensis NRIC 0473]GEB82128.1 hypothetical protein AOR01nite_06050 [Acetobacter orleanensis]